MLGPFLFQIYSRKTHLPMDFSFSKFDSQHFQSIYFLFSLRFILLEGRIREGRKDRELPSTGSVLSGCHGQDWATLKPGGRSFFHGCRGPSAWAASPSTSEVKQLGLKPAPVQDASATGSGPTCYAIAPALHLFVEWERASLAPS